MFDFKEFLKRTVFDLNCPLCGYMSRNLTSFITNVSMAGPGFWKHLSKGTLFHFKGLGKFLLKRNSVPYPRVMQVLFQKEPISHNRNLAIINPHTEEFIPNIGYNIFQGLIFNCLLKVFINRTI